MIQGTDLRTTILEIQDNARNKKDYVLSAPLIQMNEELALHWGSATGPVTTVPSAHAHNQMADYLNIPRKFYDRLKSDLPDLISINVNRLLGERVGEARMIRTLNGVGRAVMSDRYRRLDHEDLAENILPRIINGGQFQVESMKITEAKFYLQIVAPRMEGEIRVGHPVQFGLLIQNSEIGEGSLSIQAMIKILRCTNGMVVPEFSHRKAHLGARLSSEGDGGSFLSMRDETQQATDKALWMQVQDQMDSISSPEGFQRVLASLQERADDKLTGDPQKIVEELSNKWALREEERSSILYSLLREGDDTRWGLSNAVTQAANGHASYDRAVELEKIGGDVMALEGTAWSGIAMAGATR